MVSYDKDVHTVCDFNIDLGKCESSQINQDILISLKQFHPSFFNLFYQKNYRQKYYL